MDEKPKREVLANRIKTLKSPISGKDIEPRRSKQEDQGIEVDLPPGISLLQNRDISVRIMCQLLSDVDLDTINDGRIHDHLDDLLWDGLKVCLQNK